MQLAYEHFLREELKGPEWKDKLPTLGVLIGLARCRTDNKLSERAIVLSESVNALGNTGAHKTVKIDPGDVASAIHDTVVVINEIYQKKPASQSETDSNER